VLSGPASFDQTLPPADTLATSSGKLTVAIRWFPVTPIRGSDAAELTILDSSGVPVDGERPAAPRHRLAALAARS
jgi:hypothetical protein